MQGKIVKGIAGFYYVNAAGTTYECKAKGIFRKDNRKPLVGDDVVLEVLDEEKKLGNVVELLPRKSELIRPAVANVDQAMVIFAVTSPAPNLNLLDRFLVMMERQNLPCLICFNKMDLDDGKLCEKYRKAYEKSGHELLFVSAREGLGLDELKAWLAGKTTTVAGPSGVGKSSLINLLQAETSMETGTLSAKIDRGKHTTRHSQLLQIDAESFIFDTPGFSSLEVMDVEKEELAAYYAEFAEFEAQCRFGGCSHVTEPSCGVKEAVKSGEISRIRYENYCQIYEELKARKKY
ncbi:MAG: ribosome small subunit-dependent GTPase A [Lachnospiraceae bacterium]|nr:ribosome small subunit-dependent GTPase A [Lachnospiraceae bacterium]